ncbi:hypothetical protein NL501_29860, partial [Klebsiella pneumoniae]|nr:hypothetical protein [Klebsiella pneumoniae]
YIYIVECDRQFSRSNSGSTDLLVDASKIYHTNCESTFCESKTLRLGVASYIISNVCCTSNLWWIDVITTETSTI